ncbi:PDZ/DHR/GLGF domain protein [Nitrosomonas mobilis]|uniref:PDZ/DHR/GLGF domain protein n=2 Tax=Nitrosomonas mobilis TaxID=51642 RepID=A0A1G5SEH7_9PROT|nr:PDZ/DHR/GLGF domain protein [Nitrosomonas mobilis]
MIERSIRRNRIAHMAIFATFITCTLINPSLGAQISPPHKPVSTSKAISPPMTECVKVGTWTVPGSGIRSFPEIIAAAAKQSVVLLGETHINREHHRWQLQTLVALYAVHPNMIIGFEMFPRRVQAVLDRWVAGELTETEFLAQSDWHTVWNSDASLYMPLFHFARMNRIPMRALNIDNRLRKRASEKGFNSIPEHEREGVTRPAPPSAAYLDFLLPIYAQHERPGKSNQKVTRSDPDFLRFVVSQQLWDRAMAQAIHAALDNDTSGALPLVVGIMGTGHILQGFGVPHQLNDLGVTRIASLLPWDTNKSCKQLVPDYADAVFGLDPFVAETAVPSRQRLGIRFEFSQAANGALVLQIEPNSIAEATGLLDGDIITEIAGILVQKSSDLTDAVKHQAPGTWLPLKVKRDGLMIELVAKFPPLGK